MHVHDSSFPPAGANMFGSRLSEQITLRAARGLLKNGLTDPQTIKVSLNAPEDRGLNQDRE